jgi:hypothetical protein
MDGTNTGSTELSAQHAADDSTDDTADNAAFYAALDTTLDTVVFRLDLFLRDLFRQFGWLGLNLLGGLLWFFFFLCLLFLGPAARWRWWWWRWRWGEIKECDLYRGIFEYFFSHSGTSDDQAADKAAVQSERQ